MFDNARNFDLKGQLFKRDPLPTFTAMRAAGPVVRSRIPILGVMSFATSHETVSALLKHTDRFVVDGRNAGKAHVLGVQWWMPRQIRLLADNMLTNDDPDHRRLRRLVDKAFHRRSVDTYRERIAEMADALLDDLQASQDRDLVAHFAQALPLLVICDLLGLPQADRPRFIAWMASISSVDGVFGLLGVIRAGGKICSYLTDRFAERRAEPRDDLISALVQAEEGGDRFNEDELLTMCFLLFVAGHETTTHLISGGVLALLQHRDQLDRLKADWSMAPKAVDELLRFVSPVQMTKPRFVVEDMAFAGRHLKRGEPLMGLLASANADPDAFEMPERLDLARQKNRHLAFGGGPHLCLGLQLAKAEMEIALERLFTRFPDIGIAVRDEDLRWTGRVGLRALKRLPVRLAS